MKIERTKNAIRNIIFGLMLNILQIFVPFLMRTAMIYFMGVQYLGLNGLFTSILQILNLAELGVGSAMVYSMYKPIFDDDNITIYALMRLYRTYYRIIGTVIACLGVILTPFLPMLINDSMSTRVNIYVLYLLQLSATVLSYWLFAYKGSILSAYQRTDVTSKITIITNTIQYIAQFAVLYFLRNYYVYLIVALATQAFTNLVIAAVVTHMYPQCKPVGKLDKSVVKEINQRIKDLFTAKIGGVVVNSADTIVISAFLGLTILAVYQNYYYILTSVVAFVEIVFSACTAGIGNSLIVETKEKNFNDLKKFTFLLSWIAGFCTCCFLNLYQPFMEIWVGKNLTLDFSAVICFCIYFFVYEINRLLNTYKDSGGIWHEDRFRPLVTAIANLGLNLIMVQFWGIYGVLLSTVLSMIFIGMPWLLLNLFTVMFDRTCFPEYLRQLLMHTGHALISAILSFVICRFINIDLWGTLILRGVVCVMVPNAYYLLVFRRHKEFGESLHLLDRMTRGKLKLFARLGNCIKE